MALAWCHCSSFISLKKKIAPSKTRKSKYSGQAIKAIPIRVLTVGKRRSKGTQLLVEEYTQKIKYYCNIEDMLIKNNPKETSDVRSQIEAEDMVMVQHIRPDDFIVMLDENGKDIVSEEMADLIGDAANKGSMRLTFCIGGPYGHGPHVRERADVAISLSSLVLNHQVALIVLLEQIYSYSFWFCNQVLLFVKSPSPWLNFSSVHNLYQGMDYYKGPKISSLV